MVLEAFPHENMAFASLNRLWQEFRYTMMRHQSKRSSDAHLVSPLTPVSLNLLLTDSIGSKKTDWSSLNVTDRRFVQSPSISFFF